MRRLPLAIFTLFIAVSVCTAEDEDKISKLVAQLKDKNTGESARAAKDLAKMGESATPAVPALIEALGDYRPTEEIPFGIPVRPMSVSSYASGALVSLGAVAVPELIVGLERNQKSEIKGQIADILWEIGAPAKAALPQLKTLYENEVDDDVRFSALGAYAAISPSDKTSVPLLAKGLDDKSPGVRGLAARELGERGAAAAEAVPALTRTLADTEYRGVYISPDAASARAVRFDAAEALGKMGPPAKTASNRLKELMHDDDDPEVRVSAALALFRIEDGNDDALKVLIAELQNDDEGLAGSKVAAESLAMLGPKAAPAFDALTQALHHEHEYLRRSAIPAIGGIGGKRAVTALIPMLKDDDALVRRAAAESLGSLGDLAAPAVPQLIERLHDKGDLFGDSVIRAAAEALGKIGPSARSAVPELRRMAKRRLGPDIHQVAAEALKRIENGETPEQRRGDMK